MKTSYRSLAGVALAIASCLSLAEMRAAADTLSFNNATGGSGTWENGAGGTNWKDTTTGISNVSWDNTVQNAAVFAGTAGTVNVVGTVNVNNMTFTSGYTLTGDTIYKNADKIGTNPDNNVILDNTNADVTINNNLQLDDSVPSDQFDISNSGTGTLTLNGNINFVGSSVAPNGQALIFTGNAAAKYVLNGAFSGSPTVPGRLLLRAGTLTLNGDYTGTNPTKLLEIDGGTVLVHTAKTGTGTISMFGSTPAGGALLTSGAQNITNLITVQNLTGGAGGTTGYDTIGGSTADISTYSGGISMVQSGVNLTAVDGGRVNFTQAITTTCTSGIIKSGAGTVALNVANTYAMTKYANTPLGDTTADIQQGTLLINNARNTSAFGNNSGLVKIEAGATLGGTGDVLPTGTNKQVVEAEAATSVIAPGDAGQANLGIAASIGTLHLSGGVTANNGLTMDFKLGGDGFDSSPIAGTDNDSLDLGGGDFTLNGPVTINLTAIGTVYTGVGNEYTLVSGFGSWSGAPTFTINTPAGYALDLSYNGTGYDFDPSVDALTVRFVAAPEPSTYALMGLGLLALVGIRRFRRLSA